MCCGLKTHKQVASSQLAGSEQAVNKQLASSKKIFQLKQQTNRQIKTFGHIVYRAAILYAANKFISDKSGFFCFPLDFPAGTYFEICHST